MLAKSRARSEVNGSQSAIRLEHVVIFSGTFSRRKPRYRQFLTPRLPAMSLYSL